MSRSVTSKDLQYALQYGGERLLKTRANHLGKALYTLHKTGAPVPKSVAEDFLNGGHAMPMDDGLFPGHSQSYGWKE